MSAPMAVVAIEASTAIAIRAMLVVKSCVLDLLLSVSISILLRGWYEYESYSYMYNIKVTNKQTKVEGVGLMGAPYRLLP
jgi:hypothetical protein